jgi:hypothetical protein
VIILGSAFAPYVEETTTARKTNVALELLAALLVRADLDGLDVALQPRRYRIAPAAVGCK